MPGTRPQPTAMAISFAGNPLTSDAGRLRLVPRPDHRATPTSRSAGPSMQWTYAALEEMARLYVAPLPRLPMLVMLGSDETVVSSSIIRSQVAKMAEGALLELPGARHEIFMERPEIRAEVWRRIDAFLASVPARRGRPRGRG